MKELTHLECAAVDAHKVGATWADFWPTVAADVAALELDYVGRGRLVHRLVGLVASGDVDGMMPLDTAWERPAEWELSATEATR